jgi:hypothetical protein
VHAEPAQDIHTVDEFDRVEASLQPGCCYHEPSVRHRIRQHRCHQRREWQHGRINGCAFTVVNSNSAGVLELVARLGRFGYVLGLPTLPPVSDPYLTFSAVLSCSASHSFSLGF